MANGNNLIRALDLFCGAGGSSWGAKLAGINVVAAFDLWPLAGKVHRDNFPGSAFYEGRLEELNLTKLKRDLGEIDLIFASPECTNHSPAKGNKPRCEKSKDTAFQVVRFARAFKPRWIVIENVVSMKRWLRYDEFKLELKLLGYNIHEQVLDASKFGVAQSRRRLFLLGDRFQHPRKINPPSESKPQFVPSILSADTSYKFRPLRHPHRASATLERADKALEALGNKAAFLIVYYGSDGAGGWQRLNRPLRTVTTIDRFALVKPSQTGHLMRMLQVDELQKAMGMVGMKFNHGTRRDKIKMLGNAVCPPVMKTVLHELTT